MKANRVGKNSVEIRMSLSQLNSILAAIDSCCETHAHTENNVYADVPVLSEALSKAIHQMNNREAGKKLVEAQSG